MSKSHRDQRGRSRSGKRGCAQNGGCSWCGAGQYKRSKLRTERRQKRASIAGELA